MFFFSLNKVFLVSLHLEIMAVKRSILRCILLCGMLCLPLLAAAQEARTKSGTPVVAVPRTPALFAPAKSSFPDATAGTYIVVAPPAWRATLDPLLRWKRQQGFRVEWMDAEVRQRDTLRARLLARWRESSPLRPPQRYVLLVGDVDRIQAFVGRHTPSGLNSTVTDLYYGEYTGDYVPEALVGRLSVADSLELAAVVQKIVAYEKSPASEAGNRCLFVAGREERDPAPATTNGQVDTLLRLARQHRPVLQPVTHYNHDTSTAEALISLLHTPYNLVSYTGHGLRSGWSNPVLTAPMADTLAGFSPAVMVNNCCLTNAFGATCFGEQMLRGARGTVGVIGATNETLWNEDYYWATGSPGAFGAVLTHRADTPQPADADDLTLGRMLYDGCRAVSLSGSVFDAYYWEAYCLLGDPSMVPAMGTQWLPDTPAVASPLEAGLSRLDIATMPYARVSVTDDSSLLATAVADSRGAATLHLCRSLTADSVRLTLLRPGVRPLELALLPAVPVGARLAVTSWHVDDSLLRVSVANVGRLAAASPRLTLTISDSQLSTLYFPDLPAGGTLDTFFLLPAASPSRFPIPNSQFPILEALLSACADTVCTLLPITFEVPVACPRVASLAVTTPDSLPAACLLPGRDYRLEVTLTQPADSIVALVGGRRTVAPAPASASFPLRLDADCRAEVLLSLFSPCGEAEEHFWLQGFGATETFESGTLEAYPWQLSQAYPWQVDTLAAQGHYAARSAPLPDGMKSVLAITLDVLQDDSVSFLYNVSSEASDWLNFSVDGRKQGWWSGSTGWQRYAWPLAKGRHHLEWHYAKDGSTSQRDDCARLDNIRFPLCRWLGPYGNPAADSSLLALPPAAGPLAPLHVYPNPVADWLVVEYPGSAQAMLLNAVGQCVGRFTVCGTARLHVRHLPAGPYWLAVRGNGSFIMFNKIIVTR